ncbi:MAG TPA: SIS domain-containing protein [Candidatus Glassbacteria bacterium]|nr:SIS domain-containing protein [Candidatus Glassbacteria bacterium]
MSDAMHKLIEAPKPEKKKRGTEFTPAEIYQQPTMWLETLKILETQKHEIIKFLGGETNRKFLLTGAGTSAFIGLCLEGLFNKISGYETRAVGTTELITDPTAVFLPGRKYFLVHFARSGNSPESVGTFVLGEQSGADIKHIVITCNKDGKLAKMGAEKKGRSLIILLPPKTNDKSLAMTSSFSSMVVAGQYLASLGDTAKFAGVVKELAEAGNVILQKSSVLQEICAAPFERAVFLGSNTLYGCAKECHLKLQEETDGKVVGKFDTFLGLRHGPEAVVHKNTLVVFLMSEEPLVHQYELDLMNGVKKKGIGLKKLAICRKADKQTKAAVDVVIEHGRNVPDDYLSPAYVIVGQSLGVFKSLALGLKPDSPSKAGVITRVVQGVQIYDRSSFYTDGSLKVIAG